LSRSLASLLSLKLNDVNGDAVAAFAVALMVAYGVIAYRIPAVHLRLDRLGDNFYYLGFIFTLASMSAALIQLRENINNIDALLGSFGIALFTTIVGIAGRVLFVQLRTELDEIEEGIRRDLLEASNDLKAQLSLALREFETFHTGVRQAMAESFSPADVPRIADVAQTAAQRIHETFNANLSYAKALSDQLSSIADSVESLTKRMNQAELPTERFLQQLNTFGSGIEQLLHRLSSAVEEIGRVARGRRRRRWYWPFKRS
jgi:methyl-accepting chemotaxis protein